MAEYIDKDDVIQLLYYYCDEVCSTVVADLEQIPAADVAPVVRGKWNRTTSDYECSNCQYPMDYIAPHCPYCGAKMDL